MMFCVWFSFLIIKDVLTLSLNAKQNQKSFQWHHSRYRWNWHTVINILITLVHTHFVMFTSSPFRKRQVQRLVHLMRDPSPSVVKNPQHPSLAHPCASLAQEDSNMTRESPPLAIRTQPQPPNPVLRPVRDTPSQTVHTQVGSVYALSAIRRYNRLIGTKNIYNTK